MEKKELNLADVLAAVLAASVLAFAIKAGWFDYPSWMSDSLVLNLPLIGIAFYGVRAIRRSQTGRYEQLAYVLRRLIYMALVNAVFMCCLLAGVSAIWPILTAIALGGLLVWATEDDLSLQLSVVTVLLAVTLQFVVPRPTGYRDFRDQVEQPVHFFKQGSMILSTDELKELNSLTPATMQPQIYAEKLKDMELSFQMLQRELAEVTEEAEKPHVKAYARLIEKYSKPQYLKVWRVWRNGTINTQGKLLSLDAFKAGHKTAFGVVTGYVDVVFNNGAYERFDLSVYPQWWSVSEGDVVWVEYYMPRFKASLPPDIHTLSDELNLFYTNYKLCK